MTSIWSHTLVKNEDRFLWFSLKSVIDFVDKAIIYDTGSTDNTLQIIDEFKKIYKDKVIFKSVGDITINQFPKIRQEMLDATKSDWFIVLDGDEIWWKDSIKKLTNYIKQNSKNTQSIFVPTINLIGDMYHKMEKKAGMYNIQGKKGHLALRAINTKIPGLSSRKPHGTWGWTDGKGVMVQERKKGVEFVDAPYIHTTFLQRSTNYSKDLLVPKRILKKKFEIGTPLSKDFYYPEAFFEPRPSLVKSPWQVIDTSYFLKALPQTPLKMIKRRLLPNKIGY